MKSILFLLMGVVLLLINACGGTIPEPTPKPTKKEVTLPYEPETSFDKRLSKAMLNAERVMVTFPAPSEENELPDNVVAWLGVVEKAEGKVYPEPLILKGIEESNDKSPLVIASLVISIIRLYPQVAEWIQEKRTEQQYAGAKNYHAALCYKRRTIEERRNNAELLHEKVVFIRKPDDPSIPHSCYY
jgi:hypothetical protein